MTLINDKVEIAKVQKYQIEIILLKRTPFFV